MDTLASDRFPKRSVRAWFGSSIDEEKPEERSEREGECRGDENHSETPPLSFCKLQTYLYLYLPVTPAFYSPSFIFFRVTIVIALVRSTVPTS